ncbi:aldehyde dehydrogenase [Defluviimonas sp. SAOS-178_SWC]|uniref:aldehyde dehydrogenase n=1 Tax=Defluviimonas sp. SAOS-178_SWC TaxID=3121287 RepID=UPI0032220AB9
METDTWHKLASELPISAQSFVNGQHVSARSGAVMPTHNPANGKLLAEVPACDAPDVDLAVAAARRAFDRGVWSSRPPSERKRVLLRLAELISEHGNELALLETLDAGKPIADTLSVDLPAAASSVAWYAEAIDKIYDDVAPTAGNVVATITREPIGVVAAIVPWNFPLLMACWKVAPALAAGNSVILKPADLSPLSAIRLAELAAEAGVPEGVFNVVTGHGSKAGQALGMHMDVDAVSFTGSTAVGKLLMSYSAQSNMKRVALECGGKSPHIVMNDCRDLDEAARAAAFGIFFNQGEVCCAGSRLLVQEDIKTEFLERVISIASTLKPGDPLDPDTNLGALISEEHTRSVLRHIDNGKSDGANLICGGAQVLQETGGHFLEPTIFDQVNMSMRLASEEIFGPVLATLTFRDVDDAVRIANDTIYGLGAGLWTSDLDTALSVSKRLRAGTVWINNYDESDITVPFGGYKQSGIGRDKSLQALDFYREIKTTWIKFRHHEKA